MKKIIQTFLAVCAAGAVQMASAVNYSPAQLLLVFHQSGYNDVVFDIGSASGFANLPSGTVVPVSYDASLVAANFGGTLAGVNFAVVGERDSDTKVWLTQADLSAIPGALTVNGYTTLQSKINGVGVAASLVTTNSADPMVIDSSDFSSYTKIVSPNDAANVGSMDGDAPGLVSKAVPAQSLFYQFSPNTAPVLQGAFTLADDGTMVFTAGTSPLITSLSGPASTARGGNATFTVTALNATGYQWYVNGVAIAGATNASLTVSNIQAVDAGKLYTVVVNNAANATATTSLSAPSIKVTPAYLPTDLLLVLHDGSNPDLTFNLGPVSNFVNQAVNTTRAITYNQSLALANFGGSLAAVSASFVAESDSLLKLWLSDADLNTAAPTLTVNGYTTVQGKLNNAGVIGANLSTNIDYYNPLSLDPTDGNSYSGIVSPGDPVNADSLGGDAPYTVGQTFPGYSGFFELGPNVAGTFRGMFSLESNGDISFSRLANTSFYASALSPVADTVDPTVVIKAPANKSTTGSPFNPPVILSGTAADNKQVKRVLYGLNGGPITNIASGTTSWSSSLDPLSLAATNIVVARAEDFAGRLSLAKTNTFFLALYSPLEVLTTGSGSLLATPSKLGTPTNGAVLRINSSYILTAVTQTNYLFKNWQSVTNGVTNVASTSPKLSFQMKPGLAIIANFVSNQFLSSAGNYNGLLSETGGVKYPSAGFFTVKITAAPKKPATFSGSLSIAGEKVKMAGVFDDYAGTGHDTKKAVALKVNTNDWLAVTLTLPFNGSDTISGTVSNKLTGKVSFLEGDKAIPTALYAGTYTMALPATSVNPLTNHYGDGYGLVTISTNGTIKLVGNLGDGSVAGQKVAISKNGEWPLYVAANPATNNGVKVKAGFLMGWLAVTNTGLSGTNYWIKTNLNTGPFYPEGFTNTVEVLGSSYTNAALFTHRVIQLTGGSNGVVLMQDGDLSIATTNNVFLSLLNKFTAPVTNSAGVTNKLSLSVAVKTGKLTGKFLRDGAVPAAALTGAVLQNDNSGSGFFKGTNETGLFLLQGAP